ncbi:MAG: hypothetical protein V1857_06870 [archaeon]
MNEIIESEKVAANPDDLLEKRATYGVILRLPIDLASAYLKKYRDELGAELIYVKRSVNERLFVVSESELPNELKLKIEARMNKSNPEAFLNQRKMLKTKELLTALAEGG